MTSKCPFCSLPDSRVILASSYWLVIRDGYPISSGHTLLVPKRHIKSLFELTTDEQAEFFPLLKHAKDEIKAEFSSDAFNIGVNDGEVAGQTVMHLHVHLIPRYQGDQQDPRGGIRWLFPDKADYWSR